jgi:hypothetical protein
MTSTIKVNNIQNQCGANIINENSDTITIGASGDTIALASGASQTGFGRTGTVDWQTGSIKTATFTAVSGQGFFCDTNGGAFEVDLPAGSAGAIVSIQDYRNTFDTHNLTVDPNGSEKINGGSAGDPVVLSTEGQGVTFVYIDSTIGWRSVQDNVFASAGSSFIQATGGTVTCSGNFKIHTFTGPGTFCVSAISSTSACNEVSHLVIAGGGAGGASCGPAWGGAGGGGAGGYRESKNPADPYTASPLEGGTAITVTATAFPITVGAGASGTSNSTGPRGSNSVFSTITSTGGGGGRGSTPAPGRTPANAPGGSGGGGTAPCSGSAGTGNTPPVSPSQGNNGGTSPGPVGAPGYGSGGGGGATAVGADTSPPTGASGNGGAGATTCITGSPVARAGGGGGGVAPGSTAGSGGTGGGATGGIGAAGSSATANTGGGGGGGGGTGPSTPRTGGSGGSGIVVIRYKFQ